MNQSVNSSASLNRESLRDFLRDTFGIDISALNDDTSLFTTGILDSLSVADLLLYLESAGGFVIDAEEVVPENLDSVEKIIRFAEQKTGVTG